MDSSLSVSTFNLVLYAAQQKGADPAMLCQCINVDPVDLQHPDGRLPIRKVHELWREAIQTTGDVFLPLHLGELANPLTAGVLAYVMMHCQTLGESLSKLIEYQGIACQGLRTHGRLEGGSYWLSLTLESPEILYPDHAINSELAVYQTAMRALTGQRVVAKEIRFAYSQPINHQEHERVFTPACLVFDASETVLILDAAWLTAPIINANPDLFEWFDRYANSLLQKLREPTLATRVKREIVSLLKGEEPTLAIVADRLAIGVRTLQLHLKGQGVTYRQLLDEVRCDLAVTHLREPYLSTTDIAYLLGFSEPSVFYRSFKKWTGLTPGSFRGQLLP